MTYTPGTIVSARGREWIVQPKEDDLPESVLRLRPLTGTGEDEFLLDCGLEPDVAPASFPPPDADKAGTFSQALLLRDALRLSLRAGAGPFRSFGNLTFAPRAYQLVPLMMALKQPVTRLLIADDIGVGKTIESGLILRELLDRGEIERACVLCPPPLVDQWVAELYRHFHIVAKAVTASSAASLERGIPDQSLTIFQYYPFTVVSLDYIKSDAHAAMFRQTAPEFVIVDEAHTCTQMGSGKQRRWQLVKALSEDANRHMVLATATPHSGNQLGFANLLSLLKPEFAAFVDLSHAEAQSRRVKGPEVGLGPSDPDREKLCASASLREKMDAPSPNLCASASLREKKDAPSPSLCASASLREPEYLPLYEAKLIHQFDHRWATYEADGSTRDVTNAEKQDADFEIRPRYWVAKGEVDKRLAEFSLRQDLQDLQDSTSSNPVNPVNPVKYLMGWRDMARATDARTVISAIFPVGAVGNNLFLYHPTQAPSLKACLNADMNSLVHDWCARQKVGGVHVSFFVSNQIATLSPTAYTQADIDFIVPRVLELTYTSHSLKGWAEALGCTGEPYVFDPERRAVLRAELDARYAKLYGLNEQELTYILDPSAVYGPDYPSESFRVLKEKEIAEFGEYRTMRMVLEAFRKDER